MFEEALHDFFDSFSVIHTMPGSSYAIANPWQCLGSNPARSTILSQLEVAMTSEASSGSLEERSVILFCFLQR
jgi:hypothetical protein